jgi:colicin import membrane protein
MKIFFKEHKNGFLGTILFHSILAIIIIIFGFTTPLPLPEEEGILINFGTDLEGEGLIEPSASQSLLQVSQPDISTPESVTEQTETEQDILTQEFEEAPEIETKTQQDIEEEEKERLAIEEEKKRQEELERQRQNELERIRQEETERKHIEEEQRRIREIQDRTKKALSSAQNPAINTSESEGDTTGQGNQGSETGSVDSKVHSSGISGLGDKGISYSLAGRTPQSLPKPEYNYQIEGIVVVEVTVDRNGNVTNATTTGVKGSTTLNEYLHRVAKEAAKAAKFDRKPNAPAYQKGTITYHFILQ